MARKLKGRLLQKKGLSGALARYAVKETEHKQQQHALKATLEQKKNKEASIKAGGKNRKRASAQQHRGTVPFSVEDKVLLVGEGDFSFAESIVKQGFIEPANLIATSFDSLEEVQAKYPNVSEKLQFLETEGVKVVHSIDATNLVGSFKLDSKKKLPLFKDHKQLNYIMFNFPHTGRGMKDMDRNIRAHQLLMLDYFKSCKAVFAHNSEPETSSGYNLHSVKGKIIVSLFEGEPYNSWGVKMLARSENYKVERSGKFDWSLFPEYHHKRTNGVRDTTKPAAERDARFYIFEPFEKKEQTKEDSDSDS